MKKKLKLAFRGGASSGLKYFRIAKELFNKKLYPSHLVGSSSGGIFASCIACVRNPETIKKIMLSIQGDKIMRWGSLAEKKETPKFKKIIYFLGVFILKRIPINSMKKIFKKHLTWKNAKLNGVEFLAIGVVKQKDVLKTLGKQLFSEIKKDGMGDFFDGDGFEDIKTRSYDLIDKLPMYFFTSEGTYKYIHGMFIIISKKTIPLWKAVMATFSNPILPSIRLKFDKFYKEKTFDGGIANNYANLALCDYSDFYQISCMDIPKKENGKEKGIKGINKIYYNLHPANKKNECIVKSKNKYKGFFAFYDANIEAYAAEKPTNFFK